MQYPLRVSFGCFENYQQETGQKNEPENPHSKGVFGSFLINVINEMLTLSK